MSSKGKIVLRTLHVVLCLQNLLIVRFLINAFGVSYLFERQKHVFVGDLQQE